MKKLLITGMLMGLVGGVFAHDADCPYCKLKLVQNTKDQDNEVVVKLGNKRIEYRCITCVILDEKRYTKDLVVYAPSEKVGAPVLLKRTDGKWSAPEGAAFLNAFAKHADCAALARAFSTREKAEAYATSHGVDKAKVMNLDQFIKSVKEN